MSAASALGAVPRTSDSVELKRLFERRRGGEDERVLPGGGGELNRRRQSVLGGSARQRDCRPADEVEERRELRQRRAVAVAVTGRDDGEGRRDEEIEPGEHVRRVLTVRFSHAGGVVDLLVRERDGVR